MVIHMHIGPVTTLAELAWALGSTAADGNFSVAIGNCTDFVINADTENKVVYLSDKEEEDPSKWN